MSESNKTNTFKSLKGILSFCSFVVSEIEKKILYNFDKKYSMPNERKFLALFMLFSIEKVSFSSNEEKGRKQKNRKLSFVETEHKGRLMLLSARLLEADFHSQSLNQNIFSEKSSFEH